MYSVAVAAPFAVIPLTRKVKSGPQSDAFADSKQPAILTLSSSVYPEPRFATAGVPVIDPLAAIVTLSVRPTPPPPVPPLTVSVAIPL